LIADPEEVELVHPGRLDEVRRCRLAARQRGRIEKSNIKTGSRQVDGQRGACAPGPDNDDIEVRARRRQRTNLKVRLA
jgi:hypothetical protein